MPDGRSRRGFLRAGATLGAAGATGVLAGCQGLFGGGPSGDVSALDTVPADALLVVDADVDALLADEGLRAAFDGNLGFLGTVVDGVPGTTGAVLDDVAGQTGLEPRDVHRVVGFGARESDSSRRAERLDPLAGGYGAAVARTDWTPEAVRTALAAAWETVDERRYAGQSVLEGPRGAVALLDKERVAFGQSRGVEAALDARERSDREPDGQLERALGSARSGPVRFGLAPGATSDRGGGFTDPLALLAGKIDYAHGGLYREDDRRGLVVSFEAGSGADAEDVHESLDSFLALARAGQFGEDSRAVLEPLATARDGSTVRARYEAGVDAFAATLLTVATAFALSG